MSGPKIKPGVTNWSGIWISVVGGAVGWWVLWKLAVKALAWWAGAS
jgi:hypothetical protein